MIGDSCYEENISKIDHEIFKKKVALVFNENEPKHFKQS